MKKTISTLVAVLLTAVCLAQVPQKFNYQAIARTSTGEFIKNSFVEVEFAVLDGGATGAEVYKEKHMVNTDANGLISAQVGGGTVLAGDFSKIDWSKGSFWLQTRLDAGNGYELLGAQELLSVPYALQAEKATNVELVSPSGFKYEVKVGDAGRLSTDLVTTICADDAECPTGYRCTGGECEKFIDEDGDGYSIETDCNDQDPTIHADALDNTNDGIDNNCNGDVDEGYVDTDQFEPNDSQSLAASIQIGSYSNLTIIENNEDWYEISVNPGKTLDLSILFLTANGDIDLFLHDLNGDVIISSQTSSDNESILYKNEQNTQALVYAKVKLPFSKQSEKLTYDLVLEIK